MRELRLVIALVLFLQIQDSIVYCQQQILLGGIFRSDQNNSGSHFVFSNPGKFISKSIKSTSYDFKTKSVFINDLRDSQQVSKAVCGLLEAGVQVIVGPTNCNTYHIIEQLALEFDVPYFTINDVHHLLNDSNGNVRTKIQSNIIKMKPLLAESAVDFILNKKWTQVTFVYDGREDLNLLKFILILLNQRKVNIESSIKYYTSIQLKSLKSLLATKNVVICITSEQKRKDLLEKIMGDHAMRNYNFLFVEISINNLVFVSQFPANQAKMSMYTLLDYRNLKSIRENSALMESLKKADPLAFSEYRKMNIIPYDIALMIDTVNLIQETFMKGQVKTSFINLNSIICRRPAKKFISPIQIKQAINTLKYKGTSGMLTFDKSGFRNDVVFNLYEVMGSLNLAKIAEWSSNLKLKMTKSSRKELENQLGPELVEEKSTVIKVTSILQKPFLSVIQKNRNQTVVYKGFVVDLMNELRVKTGLTFSLSLVKDGSFGSMDKNGQWNGMIGEIVRGEADISISPLTITDVRSKYVDFTVPFMQTGISILYKKQVSSTNQFIYMTAPFRYTVWISIAIAFALISLALALVRRFHPGRSYTLFRRVFYRNCNNQQSSSVQVCDDDNQFTKGEILNSFWLMLRAILRQNGDSNSKCLSGRVIEGSWWLFTLILITFYTINLSILIYNQRVKVINSYDDLMKLADSGRLKFGTITKGSTQQFFMTSQLYPKIKKLLQQYPQYSTRTTMEGVEKVRNSNGDYAFFMESIMNQFVSNQAPCNTKQVGTLLNNIGYGIAMKKGSPYGKIINLALLALKEENYLIRRRRHWWVTKGECANENTDEFNEGQMELNTVSLNNVAPLTIFLAIGLVIGCLVIVLEFIYVAFEESSRKKESLFSCMRSLFQHKLM